jgi:hypothetical protein
MVLQRDTRRFHTRSGTMRWGDGVRSNWQQFKVDDSNIRINVTCEYIKIGLHGKNCTARDSGKN